MSWDDQWKQSNLLIAQPFLVGHQLSELIAEVMLLFVQLLNLSFFTWIF
jgi:hypothetical protein